MNKTDSFVQDLSHWSNTIQNVAIGTRQEQISYQRQDKIRTLTKDFYERQDKIQINRQEIIHHYKNTHIPLC